MQEIRFHGRGGQGTVLASIALAKAFFQAGFWVQTFSRLWLGKKGSPCRGLSPSRFLQDIRPQQCIRTGPCHRAGFAAPSARRRDERPEKGGMDPPQFTRPARRPGTLRRLQAGLRRCFADRAGAWFGSEDSAYHEYIDDGRLCSVVRHASTRGGWRRR